jgi:hypothetical protein
MQCFTARTTWLLLCLTTVACAAPPREELEQARVAIDAARQAGGERFAATEFAAAGDALGKADAAVAARDYRLALNYALESREHAQNATRIASDTRTGLQRDAERSIADAKELLQRAAAALKAPAGAQLSRRARRQAQERLARLETDLQKAGAALEKEDYKAASGLSAEVKRQAEALISLLSNGRTSQSPQRQR